MKVIFILFLFLNPGNDLNKIAEVNSLKKEAKAAYTDGDFEQAVQKYEKLVSEYNVRDENVMLNLANAYYKNDKSDKAMELYSNLNGSSNSAISSTSYNQSGLIAHAQKKKKEAIELFKEALKANPANEEARFNYSKLKKEESDDKSSDSKDKEEPSEFAKQLKKKAEELVQKRQYRPAYRMMKDGLQKDQTVSSFNDFIERIGEVATINGQ